jgi:hypothetical protein
LAAGSLPAPSGFSRSRWIAERRSQVRFDGGVLPARAETFENLTWEMPRPPRGVPPGPPNVRVSEDILAPDPTSAAQPETEAETFVAQPPGSDNTILAAYQEDRFSNGGARALTAALSRDGGKTWSETLLPGLTQASGGPWERASDPWVAFGADGRAYYASLVFNESNVDNGVDLSVSSDGGHTWQAPSEVHRVQNGDFDDKEAVAVDSGASSPFHGRVYVCWDTVTNDSRQVLRVSSSDNGVAFTPALDVSADGVNIGCVPLVGPDGTAYLLWQNFGPSNQGAGATVISRSTDGGASWSIPTTVALQNSVGVQGLRSGDGLPAAAVDAHSGRLWVAWTDSALTRNVDQIVVSSSSNRGQSWSAPLRVSDGPDNAPAFNPAIAVNGAGLVGVAYSTLRNDPARRFLVDEYLAVTDVHGVFQRSQRQTTKSFDVRYAALADGFFLGDYEGLAAGATTFRPIWVGTNAPSRLNPRLKQPDVYAVTPPRR